MSAFKHEINRMEESIGRQLALRRRFNRLITRHLVYNNALQNGQACRLNVLNADIQAPTPMSAVHMFESKCDPI